MDRPGEVVNPAHGQLTVKMEFPSPRSRLRIWSRETCLAAPSRVGLHIFHTQIK